MHLDLPHLTYSGPPIDDAEILERVPSELGAALRHRNGCVAYLGGLHVRGACMTPAWHSLRAAWEGSDAFHALYPEVLATDVPFAEDALGDQLLLRDGGVVRLRAETGEVEPAAPSLAAFFDAVLADPGHVFGYQPTLAFVAAGERLEPGQLLSAYPPFCVTEAAQGVELRAVDALERRRWLAALAGRIRMLPDGATIEFKLAE